jgi:PAS domain S-box-containing protein
LCRLHFYEVSPDFPSDRCDEQWAIAKKDGFFSLETTQRTKDGRLIPVEVSVSYMPFNGQEYLCGFVRDITERKKASEALVQSEEKYRSLFATMAQGVVYQDKDGRVTSANSSAERILGLPIEEMLGATSSDPRWKAITEEGIEYAGKDHPAMIALRTGEPVNNAIMGVYNPEIDDYRWLTIDAIPQYRPGEEEPYQVYTTFSDITERRQMEQAISESEEKFRMISEQSLLGIAILQDNQIKYANSAAAGIFELDREKQSNPALDVIIPLIHEDDREYVSDQLQKKQAGIKDVNNHYSFRVTPLSGNKKWIDVFSRTVSYEGRTANFATLVDITDRKRHEMIQAAHLKISEATNLSSNLESLLATIHQSLGELIDTTNFYVALYDEKNEMYSFPYCVDQNDNADFTPDDLKKSLTDYVRRTGQPLLVNEEIQMELEARGEVDLIGVPSDLWMGVPLKSANGVLGVAVVQSYTDPQCYSKDDLELMTFISGYITMALERKLAEQALRSSEERLRAMYEQASVGVALLSTDGRWLTVNERLCEIVGYSREELLQMTARDITHPDDLEDSPCILDHQLFNTPKNCKCEKRYIRKDGNIVWLTMSAALVIEPSDAEEYLFAVLEDITVRKQAELALKHSEERFRAMFEQAAIGVATISCDGTWLRVNQTMRDITGYSHEELKQMTIHDLTYPDDFQVSPKQIERIVNGEIDHYQIEKRYVRKDGEVVWVHVSASMLGEPGSNEAYLMTVIQDITERKNAEDMVAQYTDQLLKANRDLQAKQAELEEFIYTVSHDLKAPVVSISGFSGLISEKFGDALDDTGTRYLDRIRYNSEVMEELIGDLLELSRIDRADEETNPVNGDTLVDEILESFSVAAANKNVRLIKLCRLPDIDGRLHRVRQLITNLVDNAIKYMPDRQDALVEVGFDPDTLSPDGVSGAFFVRDNGAGIPEEFHGRIFGMFQRVRSNGSQAEGSGVGLAVVKRIVEKHGGELWIKSEVGKGTTFYFTLPVLRRSHPVGSSDEDSQPGHSPGVSKKAL